MISPKAIVNIKNFRHNINYVKSLLDKSDIYPVVKANAYGHGYKKICEVLFDEGIKCVCVATVKELKNIINLNLPIDILHLGKICLSNIDLYYNKKVIATINSIEDVENINLIRGINNKIRCHLKIDTGMSRMGCEYQDFKNIIDKLDSSDKINFEGIYSHLACSENKNSNENLHQIDLFQKIIEFTNDINIKYHLLNSGGVFNYNKYKLDYARIGIALYGINPIGEINNNLRPVMKLVAPVVLIKTINKGDKIGYGCTYIANNKMKIGIVQCGYADGIPISFSNKGAVYYNKDSYPILGKISMDLICVDFSSSAIKVLDEVVIWGDDNVENRLETISNKFNNNPYVFLTSVSERVERIYVEE